MAAQTTFINNMLDAAFTGTFTMKLFKTALPSGGGTELSGGSYAAQSMTINAAASKSVTADTVTFSNISPSETVVAYGVYESGVLVDEKLLSAPYTADTTTNELKINYTFTVTV